MRRKLAVLTVLIITLVGGTPAFADEGRAGDNVAVIENFNDGAFRSRARMELDQETGATVDNENVAIAHSECTDCRTIAVAVQAIIVSGDVTTFTPGNAAAAVNTNCLRCQTFAYARQEVLLADARVPISDDAKARLEGIRDEVRDASRSEASFDEVSAQLDGLVDEMVAVLQGEVDNAGAHAETHDKRDVKRNDEDNQDS